MLKRFMQYIADGKLRDNLSQSAGWLILLGASEYSSYYKDGAKHPKKDLTVPCEEDGSMGWKCGAIEPETGMADDAEYTYVLDIPLRTIYVHEGNDEKAKQIKMLTFKPKRSSRPAKVAPSTDARAPAPAAPVPTLTPAPTSSQTPDPKPSTSVVSRGRSVPQNNMTSECWGIQLEGMAACDACVLKGDKGCGGKKIRETGKNRAGFAVPLGVPL